MVHPTMIATSPTCNPEEAENSDNGESESVDSHDAVIEESETDKEKEKATSLSLQQTLKEALRVAAAQRQLQRSKAKSSNSSDIRSVVNNSNNNNNNNNNCSSAHNGTIGNTATSTNVQPTATFPLLAPFLLPGLNSATTAGTSNAIMYQIPQGVVYTNDEGADGNSLFANANVSSSNNSSENQQTSPQFMFPINSLTLQQSLLQIMSTAALSAAQLENSDRSS
ncbi:hypothetical protein LOAG_01600 [Loa loa]|uniref:Uncharacterized protein n=1 Tax=Loa loa TaxID=7209 RepID=A0A1S0U990_LOALO|nr:hypothetical protein LOAG_01600 [Loa loa]EFO26877.1 hypothetical protein LOAG_01600 [Loa loa]